MKKPEITYPRIWAFKVIGSDPEAVMEAIRFCLSGREYECEASNRSRTGKYRSFSLLTVVDSEEERDRLFFALRDHDAVNMVL